jgi:pyrimidine and pyridine-specific 5'-nucleotidase
MARVIFFDVDNCLYSPQLGVHHWMKHNMMHYMLTHGIATSEQQANELVEEYYRTYGLVVRGLIQHYAIDPVEYDRQVDQSLPLEELLCRDDALRACLERITARRWIFTNSGKLHAERVLRLLGVEDLFEGLVCCDYTVKDFPCKPELGAYLQAMVQAGVSDPSLCVLVDDASGNVEAAKALGWSGVHIGTTETYQGLQVEKVTDLCRVLPCLFE